MLTEFITKKAAWPLATALVAVLSPAANCQTRPDIDGIETEAGETELEFETRFVDTGSGTGLKFQLQAEHALSDRWAMGGEIEFEREPGDALLADAAIARMNWRAPRAKNGLGFALQAGAGYAFQDKAAVLETAAYLGWSGGDWSLSGRFDMEQLLKGGAEPEFGYRLRTVHELESGIEIGVEAKGDIWNDDDRQHSAGPFIELPLGGEDAPGLELGAFAGLNEDTPDMYYRVEIEFEF